MDYIVVLITAPNEDEAVKISKILVEEKLAACVNILKDIRSIYFWQGKIEDEQEVLMIVKTKSELFEELEKKVKSLHSYTVPEIIGIKIKKGSESYLNWISEVTK
ncbi:MULTISPECIES: divalent-cation tolerance protein CutA [Thermodesulfovibrio]|uniref:Divalent-cation tolerance protein CutA n=2 Tax=Thermodesulfovibrio yellowstonii TaxID=28262 RepID=B5YHM5_THEYD|nr:MULTISPECIES: divalent-cation tolerance protein CutA [Thermodesulfovibrio]ACI20978.1 divalent-cation tolerance protein CutA [Thermodesulfovibrio yellowstonii DSM 11347]MBC7189961.1 divalent-cation tolerance protein CutA [Candidatus Aerophobetes bacterium]MDI6865677.1 divalent-cation tolerance protein CutA [Thermodesulfovibrio yellowstonii]GLI52810.1 divalent-cation tolerance protein CutA [Thermodesulfovibrio islandicus]